MVGEVSAVELSGGLEQLLGCVLLLLREMAAARLGRGPYWLLLLGCILVFLLS